MSTIISGNTPSSFGDDVSAANFILPTAPAVGYQQGIWIPTCTLGTCGPDIGPHFWWRIGNAVTVKGNLKNFSDLTTASNVDILGLPYTGDPSLTGIYGVARLNQISYTSGGVTISYLASSGDKVNFSIQISNNSSATLKHADLNTANSAVAFTLTYLTDDTTWTPLNGATVS